MSKTKKIVSSKRLRRTIRKNPYTVGVTAALLAVSGVAAAVSRSPKLRQLKDNVLRRISLRDRTDEPALAGASHEPY